jgi:molecular chaperone HscA
LSVARALRAARHPADDAGAARIRVTFEVDADGLLRVSAREQTTGVEAAITVKPSYGLADDEIARMLEDSFAHAEDDMKARALAEVRSRPTRSVADAQRARGGRRPAGRGRAARSRPRSLPCRAARGDDHLALRCRGRSVEPRHRRVRRRRMDRSVSAALAGKRIDAVL